MGDFFKPWRRKIGVATLVLACVFAGGWVRSLSTRDDLSIPFSRGLSIEITSLGSHLRWIVLSYDRQFVEFRNGPSIPSWSVEDFRGDADDIVPYGVYIATD